VGRVGCFWGWGFGVGWFCFFECRFPFWFWCFGVLLFFFFFFVGVLGGVGFGCCWGILRVGVGVGGFSFREWPFFFVGFFLWVGFFLGVVFGWGLVGCSLGALCVCGVWGLVLWGGGGVVSFFFGLFFGLAVFFGGFVFFFLWGGGWLLFGFFFCFFLVVFGSFVVFFFFVCLGSVRSELPSKPRLCFEVGSCYAWWSFFLPMPSSFFAFLNAVLNGERFGIAVIGSATVFFSLEGELTFRHIAAFFFSRPVPSLF